jgi:hypothetical protein
VREERPTQLIAAPVELSACAAFLRDQAIDQRIQLIELGTKLGVVACDECGDRAWFHESRTKQQPRQRAI